MYCTLHIVITVLYPSYLVYLSFHQATHVVPKYIKYIHNSSFRRLVIPSVSPNPYGLIRVVGA